MAAYPSIRMQAAVSAVGGPRVDISDGGTVRIVNLNEATPYQISINHPYLTPADKATLLAFYNTNRFLPVTLTIHGVTYDCYFASGYSFEFQNSIYSQGSVLMIGNAQ